MQGLLICNYSAADKGIQTRWYRPNLKIIGNALYLKAKTFQIGLRSYKLFVNA